MSRASRFNWEQLLIELARIGSRRRSPLGTLHIPWQKTIGKRRREILLPEEMPPQHIRPIRSETRATLVASIARGRRWLTELTSDATATAETIAEREGCSVRKVNMTISLAFLAPDLSRQLSQAGSPMEWELLASPICRPNGPASTRCSASFTVSAAFEPESCPRWSPFPGNGILRPETNRRKWPPNLR